MITTRNLNFNYNSKTGFDFPDLQCNPTEALLITGGSGKGKTTFLHLLGGLLRPASGEILIGDVNLSSLSEKKLDHFRGRNIGLVLQQSHFISSLNVLENVELASWLSDKKKKTEKIQTLLEQLDLKDQIYKLPSQLSIGQQQRVSIARALINDPKLLLADEPTSSLDDENAIIVAELLSSLSKKHNAALIIVTHDQRLKDRFPHQISL
ncbi:putative ABC transport system ATP-binding protein [Flavobacterium arsenatis]|uniref:ABC transport system ATP-binding protein n=1 Tax=Flavobacterium arsenatis TaxID=1484332 RepID=A0ABU1TPY4_9FLAO|nr:ABC transporter ATP-binding protein [Flavobacterium arsenatis]MDR6967872.1 putative ABC transport system ATP-binding protein [Flavobacterium arsenatis]